MIAQEDLRYSTVNLVLKFFLGIDSAQAEAKQNCNLIVQEDLENQTVNLVFD